MHQIKRDSNTGSAMRAGIERGGCWLLVVLAGVLLMVALMSQQQKTQQLAIQKNALTLGLQTLQESIATDISIGMEIEDNPRIEYMLTRMLQSNTSLQSVNVINQQGLVIYSTNRAQLQTRLPDQLLHLIRQQEKADNWQLQWDNWWFLGVPINNAHAEEIGHIFLSKASATQQDTAEQNTLFTTELLDSLALSLLACALTGAGIVFLLGVQATKNQGSSEHQMQNAMEIIQSTQNQLQQGFVELDRLEQKE